MSVTVPIQLFNDISSIEKKLDQRKIEISGNSGIYNVLEYGAVGDGVADDTAAIQALITLLDHGDTLFFPKGNYLISGVLTLSKKINILGVGFGSQVFQSSDLDLFSYTASQQGIFIEDLYLGSLATTATKSLIKLVQTHRAIISNVIMSGSYYGIWVNGGLCNTIINPKITAGIGGFFTATSTNQYGIYLDKNGAIAPNANKIYNPIIENGVNGIYIDGQNEGGLSVYGGTIEDITGIGINLHDNTIPTVISGVHFENCTVEDIRIDDSHSVMIGGTNGGVVGTGLINILSSQGVTISDSYIDKIEIDATCDNIVFINTRYNGSGSGYIHDYGSNTDLRNLVNAGSNGDYQGGINTPNPLRIEYNGGLEVWSGGLPVGFVNFNYFGTATIVQTGTALGDTTKRFGDYAAKITGHAQPYSGLYQTLPVGIKGQWITVEYFVKLVSGSARVELWIDGGAPVQSVLATDVAGDWQRVTASFNGFLTTSTSAFILFNFPNGSVGYIDGIKIYVNEPVDPSAGVFTTLSVNGFAVTVPAAGTAALRSDKLSVFAATTSAELAGVISDEVGTGALVLQTYVDDVPRYVPGSNTENVYYTDNGCSTPFTAKINGAPTATSVVYDTDTNENAIGSINYGLCEGIKFILHNTTRGTSRNITAVDTTTNTITTENSVDAWDNNDDITTQSQTVGTVAGYTDIDVSNFLDADATAISLQIQIKNTVDGFYYIQLHPFEAYNAAKAVSLASPATVTGGYNYVMYIVPVISGKIAIRIVASGTNTFFSRIKYLGKITKG